MKESTSLRNAKKVIVLIYERLNELMDRIIYNLFYYTASEKTILTQLAGIKADVKEILLWTKTNVSDQRKVTEDTVPLDLPLSDSKQLQDVEEWIIMEDNRKKLVH